MRLSLRHLLAVPLVAVGYQAMAQTVEFPGFLSGRWTWVERQVSQTFSLDDIKARPDQSFSATLTW